MLLLADMVIVLAHKASEHHVHCVQQPPALQLCALRQQKVLVNQEAHVDQVCAARHPADYCFGLAEQLLASHLRHHVRVHDLVGQPQDEELWDIALA